MSTPGSLGEFIRTLVALTVESRKFKALTYYASLNTVLDTSCVSLEALTVLRLLNRVCYSLGSLTA